MLRLRSAAESVAGKEATSGRRGEGGVNPLTGEKEAAFATAASTRKPSENAKHPSRLLLLLEALRATFVTLCSVPSLAPISALLEPAEATPEAPSADDTLFSESAPAQQCGGAVALVERCLDKASPPPNVCPYVTLDLSRHHRVELAYPPPPPPPPPHPSRLDE